MSESIADVRVGNYKCIDLNLMSMTSLNPLSIVHISNITINVYQWRGGQEVLREFQENFHLLVPPVQGDLPFHEIVF